MATDRSNFYAGISIFVAILCGYTGLAATEHYWPLEVTPSAADSLPGGYPGTWSGEIDMPYGGLPAIGRSAEINMTLFSGRGEGQDVGSLTVEGPWVGSAAITPDCVAALYWQSGDGPINVSYDPSHSTGMCQVVSHFASATIELVASGELIYEIDLAGHSQSADLYS